MAEKVLDKKGQKTPAKGGNTGGKPQDKGGRPEASKKSNDSKKR